MVELCRKSGIAIANHGKSYRSCTGGFKLTKQVSLPNRTIAESWYGRLKGNQSDNDEPWTENTWHFVLTNCPSNGQLQISYDIIIDSVSNFGKSVNDKSYKDPMLETRCPKIMLPSELSQYAPRGEAQRIVYFFGAMLACIMFFYNVALN